jgi:hypothetical protein
MIAGVAAKQAVAIQAGTYPKPISIIADVLILGMVLLITMYLHQVRPSIPIEGIALISASLAMWGPRGIAALLARFQKGALAAASEASRQWLVPPVEPVSTPTVADADQREREEAMNPAYETKFGKTAPIRRLRDEIPLEGQLHVDELKLIAEADKAAPDYEAPPSSGAPKKGS